jgi:photosystem II stability/assembly factor-like uncharacterized protein
MDSIQSLPRRRWRWAIVTPLLALCGAMALTVSLPMSAGATTDVGKWYQQKLPAVNATQHGLARLNGVSFATKMDGWAVGDCHNEGCYKKDQSAAVIHTTNAGWPKADGSSGWAYETLPDGFNHHIYAISMVDTTHGFAVGDHQTILKYNGAGAWTDDPATRPGMPSNQYFSSVSFVSAEEGWAVGDTVEGTYAIYHRVPDAVGPPATFKWVQEALCSDFADAQNLRGVHMTKNPATGAISGWVVGGSNQESGRVIFAYTPGTTGGCSTSTTPKKVWKVIAIDDNGILYGVSSPREPRSDNVNAWAVGRYIYRQPNVYASTAGDPWNREAAPARPMLHSVAFADKDHGWAVGGDGVATDGKILMRHNDTSPWFAQPAYGVWPTTSTEVASIASLRSVDAIDPCHAWAVGGVKTEEASVRVAPVAVIVGYRIDQAACEPPPPPVPPVSGGTLAAGSSPSPSPIPPLPKTGSGPVDRSSGWLVVAVMTTIIALGGVVTAVRLMPERRKG